MTSPPDEASDSPPTGPARPPRRGDDSTTETPNRSPGEDVTHDGVLRQDDDDSDLFFNEAGDLDEDWNDHDYVELPAAGNPRKWALAVGVALLLVVLSVGGAWRWYQHQIDPPGPPGAAVTVEIPNGSTRSGIATILEDEGVISSARVFNFWAGRKGISDFQAGSYQFQRNSGFELVLSVLGEGPTAPVVPELVKVAIPEGLIVPEVLERISTAVPRMARADLDAAIDSLEVPSSLRPEDVTSYEGLLFPATYDVAEKMTGPLLLARMATEMESRVTQLGPDSSLASINERFGLDLDLYDIMIVASMVQAEAGNADEAAQIATVIYNRLGRGMALQIDAVDRYGAELAGTSVDYDDATLPYNSRRKLGLPPTPIEAPGDYALRAAFEPAVGDWLYYVLVEPRSHLFTADYDEFLAGKRTCIELGLGCG